MKCVNVAIAKRLLLIDACARNREHEIVKNENKIIRDTFERILRNLGL